jgi:hypothetical protein
MKSGWRVANSTGRGAVEESVGGGGPRYPVPRILHPKLIHLNLLPYPWGGGPRYPVPRNLHPKLIHLNLLPYLTNPITLLTHPSRAKDSILFLLTSYFTYTQDGIYFPLLLPTQGWKWRVVWWVFPCPLSPAWGVP